MLKALAWVEIVVSILLLGLAIWPFSGLCSGRFMGLDCESRAIFAVNMFGPSAIISFTCSAWSLKTKSMKPQYVLALGAAAVAIYWLSHAL